MAAPSPRCEPVTSAFLPFNWNPSRLIDLFLPDLRGNEPRARQRVTKSLRRYSFSPARRGLGNRNLFPHLLPFVRENFLFAAYFQSDSALLSPRLNIHYALLPCLGRAMRRH